jgi:hypothetical protein
VWLTPAPTLPPDERPSWPSQTSFLEAHQPNEKPYPNPVSFAALVFFLHEINTLNPLFRLYMGYVFPLLRSIDEGNEVWVRPTRLPTIAHATWDTAIDYFTFLPDFFPKWLLHRVAPLERALETSRLRSWSAHYVAMLHKDG